LHFHDFAFLGLNSAADEGGLDGQFAVAAVDEDAKLNEAWAAVREEARLSDWLRDKLELWRFRFPDPDDTHNNVLFTFHNFLYALQPKGYFANVRCGLDRLAKIEDWKKYGRNLENEVARLLSSLPSHYELLTQIRNSSFATADPFRSSAAIMGLR